MREIVFYLGIGTLFTHELDAVANHEWRVLPLIQSLPDNTGMMVFVALHVPLFAGLVALVASSNHRTRRLSRMAFGAFLVIHGLLHALFKGNPAYEFSSILSVALIFGGAALGAIYLTLEWRNGQVQGN